MTIKNSLNTKQKKVDSTLAAKTIEGLRKFPTFVKMESFIESMKDSKLDSEVKNQMIEDYTQTLGPDILSMINKEPAMKDLDLSNTGIFPLEFELDDTTGAPMIFNVISTPIDMSKVKLEIIEEMGVDYVKVGPLTIKTSGGDKPTNIKIAIDADIKKTFINLLEGDSDFFTKNTVVLKNIISLDYVQFFSDIKLESFGEDEKGNKIVLNKNNFDRLFSITKVEEDDSVIEIPAYSYNENGNLEMFGDEFKVFNIDKVYKDKLDNVINPFLGDLVDAKIMINEIMLGRETGTMGHNQLKESAENIIKAYQGVYEKYSENIFFDHRAMTELEKAFNEFAIYLKQSNEKKDSYNGEDADYKNKLDSFMDKKSEILIERIVSLDSYLQEVSDEEKTYLENTIGPNGELRKKISGSPQSYLSTKVFDQLLQFQLNCEKYKDTPVLIGHAGIGKTYSSKVAASLLRKPVFQLTGHYDFSLSDLVGTIKQNNKGYFVLSKGPLVKLAESGGILILDEFNALPQEVMKALNGLLDEIKSGGGGIWNVQIQGENLAVKVSPDLRMVLTGNPSGYSAEYGNLASVTTDLSRRTVVRELPPIEMEIKKVKINNQEKEIVTFPMIDAFFSKLDINEIPYFKEKGEEVQKVYKTTLKNKTTKFLTELLMALGKGHIDKTNQVGLDAKNFFVLVSDPAKDADNVAALKNVALSIPSIVLNRLNEIIKYSSGKPTDDLMKYLETYIFEALRSDPKGEILINKLTETVNKT